MRTVLTNWKTSSAVIPFVGISVLLHFHDIAVRDAITLLAGLGAYVAAVSGDAKQGDAKKAGQP